MCFGKFSLNAAGQAPNLSKLGEKWLRKMNMKLAWITVAQSQMSTCIGSIEPNEYIGLYTYKRTG